jgi:ferredoxin
MWINPRLCVGCANCVPFCPVGAIAVEPGGVAVIDRDTCVECANCYRSMSRENLPPWLVRALRKAAQLLRLRPDPDLDICPTGAITPEPLEWPRVVRSLFSDPTSEHKVTGVAGRGTEEAKTNDVTGRTKEGQAGFTVELGRPGVGVTFGDIERMTVALARLGISFEPKNPVTSLMEDPRVGRIRRDILQERILSAIVEFTVPLEQVPEVLRTVEEVSTQLDTVVSIGVYTKNAPDGSNPLLGILHQLGYRPRRAKVNMGLGRPLAEVR